MYSSARALAWEVGRASALSTMLMTEARGRVQPHPAVQAEGVGLPARKDQGGFHRRQRLAQRPAGFERRIVPAAPGKARAPPFDLAGGLPDALHALVGGRDPVADRKKAVELLAEVFGARRRAGVVGHLEGFGECVLTDGETDLMDPRQHEGSALRLLPGLVSAQAHCAGGSADPRRSG